MADKTSSYRKKMKSSFLLFLVMMIIASPLSSLADTLKSNDVREEESQSTEPLPDVKKKGLSTKAKIGIGVGVVALAAAGVAAATSSGGNDDKPTAPAATTTSSNNSTSNNTTAPAQQSTQPQAAPAQVSAPSLAEIPGTWNAYGVGHVQNMTYSGTYTFYSGGTHSYNLLFTDNTNGTQETRSGNGRWYLNGAYFEMHNDTGSVYTGSFSSKNSISVTTTNGWWTTKLAR